MIPKCCLFCSSSYNFRDKPFCHKNVRICIFFSHDQKWKFSTKNIFFLWWSQNCFCFALAFSSPDTACHAGGTLGRGRGSQTVPGRRGWLACSHTPGWTDSLVHRSGPGSHYLQIHSNGFITEVRLTKLLGFWYSAIVNSGIPTTHIINITVVVGIWLTIVN